MCIRDSLKFRQPLHRSFTHEAKIRMVIDRLHTHPSEQLVEALRRTLFKEGVLLSVVADAIDNVCAVAVLIDHRVDGLNIILQIRVHRDRHIRVVRYGQQTAQQRILVSPVSRKLDSRKYRVALVQFFNQRPCPVL